MKALGDGGLSRYGCARAFSSNFQASKSISSFAASDILQPSADIPPPALRVPSASVHHTKRGPPATAADERTSSAGVGTFFRLHGVLFDY